MVSRHVILILPDCPTLYLGQDIRIRAYLPNYCTGLGARLAGSGCGHLSVVACVASYFISVQGMATSADWRCLPRHKL